MSNEQAYVIVRDGQLILVDPAAAGCLAAVESHNRAIAWQNMEFYLQQNKERLMAFANRILSRSSQDKDVVVALCADDTNGSKMLSVLMPGHDWQSYREKKEVPFGRGIAPKETIASMVKALFPREDFSSLEAPLRNGCWLVMVSDGIIGLKKFSLETQDFS